MILNQQVLRGALDAANLKTVQIVAADGSFAKIAANVQSDPALKAAVSILGSVVLTCVCVQANSSPSPLQCPLSWY